MATTIPLYERDSDGDLVYIYNSTIWEQGTTDMIIETDGFKSGELGLLIVAPTGSTAVGIVTIKAGNGILSSLGNKNISIAIPTGGISESHFVVLNGDDESRFENIKTGTFHFSASTHLKLAYFQNK